MAFKSRGKGHSYYLSDVEIDTAVKALSSMGMAYNRLPRVYPEIGWLVDHRLEEIKRCRELITKLQAKQEDNQRNWAPLLEEKDYEGEANS